MMRLRATALSVSFSLLIGSNIVLAQSPSFDCKTDSAADEQAICSNERLAELDRLMAVGHEYVRANYGAAEAKSIGSPLLQSRQACGADEACIEQRQIDAVKKYQSLGARISLPSSSAAKSRARTVGPTADYKIDPEHTSTSPDGTTTIEQYAMIGADGDYTWQFWARHRDKLTMLEPEQPDYAAGFRFTNDSQWLVRMQKTGSGSADLYLYRQDPQGFVAATPKPLSDLAWAYFESLPDSRKIGMPDYHIETNLVKGADENYRWMGVKWPDSRYLVISLSGQAPPNDQHGRIQSLRGWRCRYDLQNGTFDVPPGFAENNAKAIAPDSE
jgi:uncharacterized protein